MKVNCTIGINSTLVRIRNPSIHVLEYHFKLYEFHSACTCQYHTIYAYPNLQPKRPDKENNFKPTYANFFENSTQAKLGMSIQKQ
jgi:hypothetical protein